MNAILITDDNSATKAPVVRLSCDCLWEDKTFRGGAFSFAKDHLIAKHGGNGKLQYNGQYRTVENGFLMPETHPIH